MATLEFTIIHCQQQCDSSAACVGYNPVIPLTFKLYYKLLDMYTTTQEKVRKSLQILLNFKVELALVIL